MVWSTALFVKWEVECDLRDSWLKGGSQAIKENNEIGVESYRKVQNKPLLDANLENDQVKNL